MSRKTSAVVLSGNGTNCEMETAHACRLGGFRTVDIVTVWELVNGEASLDPYDILCLPGGFLDGDDLGSAKAQANRLLHSTVKKTGQPLFEQFLSFINNGKLIFGICNGFQLMVKLGFLPALRRKYTPAGRNAYLTTTPDRFEDRWVWLKADPASPCIFTQRARCVYLPVRHGEGKFASARIPKLDELRSEQSGRSHLYNPDTQEPAMKYPDNPNGSQSPSPASAIPRAGCSASCPTPRPTPTAPTIRAGRGSSCPKREWARNCPAMRATT